MNRLPNNVKHSNFILIKKLSKINFSKRWQRMSLVCVGAGWLDVSLRHTRLVMQIPHCAAEPGRHEQNKSLQKHFSGDGKTNLLKTGGEGDEKRKMLFNFTFIPERQSCMRRKTSSWSMLPASITYRI